MVFILAALGNGDRRERTMAALDGNSVTLVKPGQAYVGKQGITYGAGALAGQPLATMFVVSLGGDVKPCAITK